MIYQNHYEVTRLFELIFFLDIYSAYIKYLELLPHISYQTYQNKKYLLVYFYEHLKYNNLMQENYVYNSINT